ncbi:MAG: entry exclusion lipoprotein TrbK [Pseudomonadota bacterium]|nr:entry exclusion lipoprotein TrbK [Pseudomonadota bacterium]
MKPVVSVLLISMLTACNPQEPANQEETVAANAPSVDELAVDPDRLKELRQQCKTDRPSLGDVLCNRVAEATHKRFYGDGDTPYTPPEDSPSF